MTFDSSGVYAPLLGIALQIRPVNPNLVEPIDLGAKRETDFAGRLVGRIRLSLD